MADRSTLHISKLDEFREWLIQDGWQMLPLSNNIYELLRAKKQGKRFPLIVYKKDNAKEHLSLADRDMPIVEAFLRDSKKKRTNADKIRAMSDEELAAVIMCPYAMGDDCEEFAKSIGSTCNECCLKWLRSEAEE